MDPLEEIAVLALQTATIPDAFRELNRQEQSRVVAAMERDIEKSREMVERVSRGDSAAPGARRKLEDWAILMDEIRSAMDRR